MSEIPKSRVLIAMLIAGLIPLVMLAAWQKIAGSGFPERTAPGQTLYLEHCADCHDAEGSVGLELTAGVLQPYYSVSSLFRYVRTAMPEDAPGSLSDQDYWSILAFMLDRTGLLPPGTARGGPLSEEMRLRR